MKKDVFIKIKGTQLTENDVDKTELFTQGNFYKRNGNYYIAYDETETTGYEGSRTTLKVEGDNKVTLIRTGNAKSHLIMQTGIRTVGYYGTIAGEIVIGVFADEVDSTLTDDGGDLHFSYSLDINSSKVSHNKVYVSVQPDKKQ